MKKYLLIQNVGEIDTKAFELIGASTKRDDDTKIGRFGSGLNYSIAWLMRNNIDFKVFSGENEILFGKREDYFRGKRFEIITINGKDTSFTTDMGVDWEAWFVIREIFCNAIDEVNYSMDEVQEIIPTPDSTRFYIQINHQIQEVIDNWENYFSFKRTDLVAEVNGVKVYSGGEDLIVYRKGIRCHFVKGKRCAFHYDMPDVKINESRIVDDTWELDYSITKFWSAKATPELLKKLMRKIIGNYEYGLKWDLCDYNISDAWQQAIGERYIVEKEFEDEYKELSAHNNPIVLPSHLVNAVTSKFENVSHIAGNEGKKGIQVLQMSDIQRTMINEALAIFKECEYEVSYPIYVCKFNKRGILALAYDKKIFLSVECFANLKFLIQAIIEENEHNNTGFNDNTREFQTHFIKLFLEEKIKRFNINL